MNLLNYITKLLRGQGSPLLFLSLSHDFTKIAVVSEKRECYNRLVRPAFRKPAAVFKFLDMLSSKAIGVFSLFFDLEESLKHSINGPMERRVKQTDHQKDGRVR